LNPAISVVMPVRNGMPFLSEAIASIQSQNYTPLELVIVDDGSTDDSREFVRGLSFRGGLPIRVLEVPTGSGPAAARNAGMRASISDLVAFLDSDDLWPDGTLTALVKALADRPDAGFAQGLICNFRAEQAGVKQFGAKQFITPAYRFLNLGANLWRRNVFETVGLLDEDLRLCEDLDFLMRCWEKDVRKVELDRVALYYRRHLGSLTHGLSGAGYGTVKAYKKKIDRIRRGEHDPSVARHICLEAYLGKGPAHQDGSLHEFAS
jgi:glycosyltransferase involved in cell wall biosynthesis